MGPRWSTEGYFSFTNYSIRMLAFPIFGNGPASFMAACLLSSLLLLFSLPPRTHTEKNNRGYLYEYVNTFHSIHNEMRGRIR